MITFGDPAYFAARLEWHCDASDVRPWMYGIFQILLCGEHLGSLSDEVQLNWIRLELEGWKSGVATRSRYRPDLMDTDPLTTFLSLEGERFGFDHVQHMIPANFTPYRVPPTGEFQLFDVEAIQKEFRVYCIEDETRCRLLHSRNLEPMKDCRIPRTVFNDVLFRTIDQLNEWYSHIPEPPPP